MKLVVLVLLAAGLMWSALHPEEFAAGVYRVRDTAESVWTRGRTLVTMPDDDGAAVDQATRIYHAWEADPVYDIPSLEALYLESGHPLFLVHLAKATSAGCDDRHESAVLNNNLDRIPTRWSAEVEAAVVAKARRCARTETGS